MALGSHGLRAAQARPEQHPGQTTTQTTTPTIDQSSPTLYGVAPPSGKHRSDRGPTPSAESGSPVGVVARAETETLYQYDDGIFEFFGHWTSHPWQQVANLFTLDRPGIVTGAQVCFTFYKEATGYDTGFELAFYSAETGDQLVNNIFRGNYSTLREPACLRLRGAFVGTSLPAGGYWVAIAWENEEPITNTLLVGSDREGDGPGTRAEFRRGSAEDGWNEWQPAEGVKAWGIRLYVDHGDAAPPPTDDPNDPDDPPPTPGANCTPRTTVLSFDGGYRVSMCWRTSDGREGQARSGIWASGQAGLLWFFDPDNAEVLVKVLNGCRVNGHRWVFVAPVTDVHFNLWVTGPDGRRWTYSNAQGNTAPTRSDTSAFPCE